MIIEVNKYLVMGMKGEIDHFLAQAQELGIAEFISPSAKSVLEFPLEVQHLLQALKILKKLPLKKEPVGDLDPKGADELALRIIDLRAEIERLNEEKRLLETEIVRVAPFGDFSLDDIDFIEKEGKRYVQFFCQKSTKAHASTPGSDLIFVGSDHDLDYFLSVSREPVTCRDKIEMRIDRPLGELQTHLGFVKESIRQLEAELKGYAGYSHFLHDCLLSALNDYHLHRVKKQLLFPLENGLFVIEAWIPQNKIASFFQMIEPMAVHCESIAIEEHERVPTYMENKGTARIGEELVKIYDIPATTDKDPSGWVFWCFVFFFSMIVNDGGYGLLYLGACLYCRWKFPQMKAATKRLLHLATILSTGCVIWGVLTASFFGLQFAPDGWISRISAINYLAEKKATYHLEQRDDVYQFWLEQFPSLSEAKTGEQFLQTAVEQKGHHREFVAQDAFRDSIFLELSLVIGMVHISLSLLRYVRRHVAGVGWVIFIVGAYLYFPSILKATSLLHYMGIISKSNATQIGLQIIDTGVILAVVLALFQKKWKGFGEVSTLISVFADVLSYLRLYALGLSTAIMAETFNNLGQDIGLFIGFLVIFAGHGITIMMGLMTGAIHGLRLNFIEWYHYSFHGGGRLLRPLMCFKSKERS